MRDNFRYQFLSIRFAENMNITDTIVSLRTSCRHFYGKEISASGSKKITIGAILPTLKRFRKH